MAVVEKGTLNSKLESMFNKYVRAVPISSLLQSYADSSVSNSVYSTTLFKADSTIILIMRGLFGSRGMTSFTKATGEGCQRIIIDVEKTLT